MKLDPKDAFSLIGSQMLDIEFTVMMFFCFRKRFERRHTTGE
jgi:hypothetical protein